MITNSDTKTLVIDDEANKDIFSDCRSLISRIDPSADYAVSLKDGLKALGDIYHAGNVHTLLLFLDIKFPESEDISFSSFANQLRRIAFERMIVVILTNFPGESDQVLIDYNLSIAKWQVKGSAELLLANIKSLLKGDVSDKGNENIQCGQIIYPLKRSAIEIQCLKLGVLLKRQLPSRDVFERIVHWQFQRIRRLPPHRWSSRDYKIWAILTELIDIDEYHLFNPTSSSLIGKIIDINIMFIKVKWYGGTVDKFDFKHFPPEAAIGKKGDTIALHLLRYSDGRKEYLACHIYKEDDITHKSKPKPLKGLDILPIGEWPLTTTHNKRGS